MTGEEADEMSVELGWNGSVCQSSRAVQISLSLSCSNCSLTEKLGKEDVPHGVLKQEHKRSQPAGNVGGC